MNTDSLHDDVLGVSAREPIRLAFTGSSATGKTRLAEHFAKRLNLAINPIGSRSVAKEMGVDSPYDVDQVEGMRYKFQRRLFEEKREWETQRDSFVTDRAVIDNLAYLILHNVHSVDADLYKAHLDHMRRYTLVVFTPMTFVYEPGNDQARVNDPTYQKIYEVLISGLLEESLRNTFLMLTSSDWEVRTAQVEAALAELRPAQWR